MKDLGYQPIDAAPSEWLDAGSGSPSGTLYGSKDGPPPPPPPPPPPDDPSIIRGTDADDMLQGTAGDNTIYGGKGQDTVAYRGTLGEHELSFDATAWGYRLIDKVSGRDGSDLLNGVERLQFDGLSVLLGHDGSAHLEDGTELLAPYVPPPPPEGWDSLVGIADPIATIMPVAGGGSGLIEVDCVEGEPVMAHWLAHANTGGIGLNGVATLAADIALGDA